MCILYTHMSHGYMIHPSIISYIYNYISEGFVHQIMDSKGELQNDKDLTNIISGIFSGYPTTGI